MKSLQKRANPLARMENETRRVRSILAWRNVLSRPCQGCGRDVEFSFVNVNDGTLEYHCPGCHDWTAIAPADLGIDPKLVMRP